ncbi:MAG: PaaI family thioesterase [Pseudomonadota bacterium]|nr:PaaI family thioesterase [Pseudomonadota bacterium]
MRSDQNSGADHCFVCGSANPIGLKLEFTVDGDVCSGEFTSAANHAGFDGLTHGGIIFSVLDDAMANWFFLQGACGYTAKSEIRYREAMLLGSTAAIECTMIKRKGRLVQLTARAINRDTGNLIAESEGSFMLEDLGNLPPS